MTLRLLLFAFGCPAAESALAWPAQAVPSATVTTVRMAATTVRRSDARGEELIGGGPRLREGVAACGAPALTPSSHKIISCLPKLARALVPSIPCRAPRAPARTAHPPAPA